MDPDHAMNKQSMIEVARIISIEPKSAARETNMMQHLVFGGNFGWMQLEVRFVWLDHFTRLSEL